MSSPVARPSLIRRRIPFTSIVRLALLLGALGGCLDISAPSPDAESSLSMADPRAGVEIELKYREDLQVRQVGGMPQSLRGDPLRASLSLLSAHAGGTRPLVTLPEDQLQRLARDGRPSLRSWYRVTVPTRAEAAQLVAALRALPEIEAAYLAPEPAPPPRAAAMTPIFTSEQGYYGPAPGGIDAEYARSLPGGRGQGITVVDLEYDWYFAHEDLGLDPSILLAGEPYTAWGDDHGTAVLGQLVARDNGYGMMGGVPDATIRVVSPWSGATGYNPANAIATAAASMRAGDVLLIQQQTWGPTGAYVPVEWVASVYDAIRLATQAGIVVVEPAGNGGVSLDGPEFGGRFDRSQYDSGAIIVGAGTPLREWLYLSSYGSRVDLQGWGASVATTGYGGLYGATKAEYYTGTFSGTSSAAPVVASAVAAVQSHSRLTRGAVLTPREVADLLKRTGTPQAGDLANPIGPLPNLRAALGAPSLTTAALNGPYAGNEGQAIAFSSAGSSAAAGGSLTYRWSFGDGTISTLANPTRSYTDDGSYAVSLTVTDALGASSTASTTATITNVPPTATFTAPASIVEGNGYVVKLAGTDAATADRATLLYALDCGLGQGYGAWSSTVKSVTCPVQPDQRALTVRGKVRDKDGGETEYTKTVSVTNAAPVVTFTATTATSLNVGASLGVQFGFTDKGVNDGPWSFSIAWGDGTAKTTGASSVQGGTASASHTYAAPGTFNAQVSVTDKDGTVGKSTRITVTVTR